MSPELELENIDTLTEQYRSWLESSLAVDCLIGAVLDVLEEAGKLENILMLFAQITDVSRDSTDPPVNSLALKTEHGCCSACADPESRLPTSWSTRY